MLGFLRRRSARGGGLGAAVTGIPSAPLVAAPVATPEPAATTHVVVPSLADASPGVTVHATQVQLGFRDGTSASLDPASADAQALEQLARLLTGGH